MSSIPPATATERFQSLPPRSLPGCNQRSGPWLHAGAGSLPRGPHRPHSRSTRTAGPPPAGVSTKLVMGYYDGNTVTALWNYAQHFAMSDNSYDTNFGPSTPGAINLVSGQTNNVTDSCQCICRHRLGRRRRRAAPSANADPVGDVLLHNHRRDWFSSPATTSATFSTPKASVVDSSRVASICP